MLRKHAAAKHPDPDQLNAPKFEMSEMAEMADYRNEYFDNFTYDDA